MTSLGALLQLAVKTVQDNTTTNNNNNNNNNTKDRGSVGLAGYPCDPGMATSVADSNRAQQQQQLVVFEEDPMTLLVQVTYCTVSYCIYYYIPILYNR